MKTDIHTHTIQYIIYKSFSVKIYKNSYYAILTCGSHTTHMFVYMRALEV